MYKLFFNLILSLTKHNRLLIKPMQISSMSKRSFTSEAGIMLISKRSKSTLLCDVSSRISNIDKNKPYETNISEENKRLGEQSIMYKLINYINNGWKFILLRELDKPYMKQLNDFLEKEKSSSLDIYPSPQTVFNALNLCSLEDVKGNLCLCYIFLKMLITTL